MRELDGRVAHGRRVERRRARRRRRVIRVLVTVPGAGVVEVGLRPVGLDVQRVLLVLVLRLGVLMREWERRGLDEHGHAAVVFDRRRRGGRGCGVEGGVGLRLRGVHRCGCVRGGGEGELGEVL